MKLLGSLKFSFVDTSEFGVGKIFIEIVILNISCIREVFLVYF